MEIICVLACLIIIAFSLYGFYLFGSDPKPNDPYIHMNAMLIGLSPMLFFIGLMGLIIVLFF